MVRSQGTSQKTVALSYSVHVRRAAERDVAEAQHWYEKKKPGLAAEFHGEFEAAIARLAHTPLMYPELYRGVRRAVLHRFPYLIWYQIRASQITVLACTHARFGPKRLAVHLR